jgi:hypothetical protein
MINLYVYLWLFFLSNSKFFREEIYYNGIQVGRNGGKKGETFPSPHEINGSKDSSLVICN